MEWISVEDKLPGDKFGKYLIRKVNDEQKQAFFMPDKMAWIAWYGMKTSYWMEVFSGELVHNVTHWMPLPDKPEDNNDRK